jgi:hypothetical protein
MFQRYSSEIMAALICLGGCLVLALIAASCH